MSAQRVMPGHNTSHHESPNQKLKSGATLDKIKGGGDVAQLAERRTGTPLRQVRFPGAARDFSPRVNFQSRLSVTDSWLENDRRTVFLLFSAQQ